jgi:hypothetical protein
MLFALLALAAMPDWVPARWNSGDPKSLALLAGTPVNCVLLAPAQWNAEFARVANEHGIATLGSLRPSAEAETQALTAARLKLNGVVLEGNYEPALEDRIRASLANTNLVLIELPNRQRIRLDSGDAILGTSQALWPGVQIEHGGTVSTGPTSTPWIDTNAGFIRFVRAATNATLWIGARPPPGSVFPVERYQLAIADAATVGARWIISLDQDFEARLFKGDHDALQDWRRIASYESYFEDRKEWRAYRPFSQFELVQDAATGGLLSAGLLDMLAVQHTAVRPLPAHRLSQESLHGARIVLNIDGASVSAEQKRTLDEFAAGGGVVLNPPVGWRFAPPIEGRMTPDKQQAAQIQRVWEIAYQATARKNFGARTFNTSTVLFNCLASPDGNSLIIHLLNYTDYPAEAIAVQALGKWRRARLYKPEGPMQELEVYPVKDGTGVDVERLPVLATLRLER